MASWHEFDIFALQQACPHTLPMVGQCSLESTGASRLLSRSRTELQTVLQAWEAGYKANAYHNAAHATDVAQGVFHLLCVGGLGRLFEDHLVLAMQVASLIHDVGHPAVSNAFLVATGNALAVRYNDRSVLENFHCATGFELMLATGVDLLGSMAAERRRQVRSQVISLVLATDMAHHHESISAAERFFEKEKDSGDWAKDGPRELVMAGACVHGVDISNSARPWEVYMQWLPHVLEEFFAQADEERRLGLSFVGDLSFLDRRKRMNVPEFQLRFASMLVLPLYLPLKGLFPDAFERPLATLEGNIEQLRKDAKDWSEHEKLSNPPPGPPLSGHLAMYERESEWRIARGRH